MRTLFWLSLMLLVAPPFAPVHGQTIDVGIFISEETGGLFESGIRSALRRLGDIALQPWTGTPTYRIYAVVLCAPDQDDCRSARSYSVSIHLTKPLTVNDLAWSLYQVDTAYAVSTSSLDKVAESLSGFARPVNQWVANWNRNGYQQSLDELVAEIDAKCFERHRLWVLASERLVAGDQAGWERIGREMSQGGTWAAC